MQISKGPTSSSLFLLTVMLHLANSRWTSLTKKLKIERKCPKRSSKRATGADQRFSVRITGRLGWRFDHSYEKVITYRIPARRVFGWFTAWDAAICFLELTICPLHTQVNSFRLPMRMTVCANGVRGLHSRRQTRGPQVRTLRLLPTSEITLRKFGELSKDPGSASRLSEPQFGELKNGGRRPSWVIVFA